jgi:serine/threonine protein kinase
MEWSGCTYVFSKRAGKGSYGEVDVFHTSSGTAQHPCVALKTIPDTGVGMCPTAVREACCLSMLSHPCVVRLLDVTRGRGCTVLYLEYMPLNLRQLLKTTMLSTCAVRCYARQILQSLRYCHGKGVIHRDVKPANLLIKDHVLKLADFGLARVLTDDFPLSTNVVTLWYRAPELLATPGTAYTSKVDVWAAGCVIGEMMVRAPLFPGTNPPRVRAMIDEFIGKTARLTANLAFNDLIHRMLNVDPVERPSASDALEHVFFWDYT